jgi:hypothetical protein
MKNYVSEHIYNLLKVVLSALVFITVGAFKFAPLKRVINRRTFIESLEASEAKDLYISLEYNSAILSH